VTALYLYGITRPGRVPRRLADDGIALLEVDDRAAIVSAVEASPIEATRRNLLAHADVVESLHERAVVLPARFGTVLADQSVAVELVSLPAVGLLLERHADTSELTVKGSYTEEVVRELAPGVVGYRDAYRLAPTLDNGLALGEAVAEALAARRARDADRILDELRPLALEVRVGDADGEYAAVNLALLVERVRLQEVSDAIEVLAAELSPPLRFKVVGPLPPYSFVDLECGVTA